MADDTTKISTLPLSENLDDDDLLLAVEDGVSKKSEVGYLKTKFTEDLATVASSGSYADLSNTPTIPDELADLSDDSTHRTVTDAEKSTWNGKQNALTFDNVPTANSSNPVKSGGVYSSLSSKANTSDLATVSNEVTDIRSDGNGKTYTSAGDSVRGQVGTVTTEVNNVRQSIDSGFMYKYLTWTAGYLGGNAGQALTTHTGGTDIYVIFTPNRDMTIYTEDGYIMGVRIVNSSNIVEQRINNKTFYNLSKNVKYAIQLHATDGSNIQSIDPFTMCKCFYYTFIERAIKTCDAYDLQRINGNSPINVTWTNGCPNGNAGDTITYRDDGNFGIYYKYTTFMSEFPIIGMVKDGYKGTIRSLTFNNKIISRINGIYNAFALPAGKYCFAVESTPSTTDITAVDISDIISLKNVISTPMPIPYVFNREIGMTSIATGLTNRRVQGGTVYGNYAWYVQPANPESGNTLVVKVNLTDGSTVTSIEDHSYGHAGAMTYNPDTNKIIILDYKSATSYFYELDADTLELQNTYTDTLIRVWGIAYDKWSGNYKLLTAETQSSGAMAIVELDASTYKVNKSVDPIYINPLPGQDIGYDGEFYYTGAGDYYSAPGGIIFRNGILVFDKAGNFITCHPINSNDEIQWTEVSNGKLYGMLDRSAVLYCFDRTKVWDYQG